MMDGPTRGERAGARPAADVTSAGAAVKVCPSCGGEYGAELLFCPRDGSSLRMREPAADLVGQTVGDRYHVLQRLGSGGMGEVFLVEHVKLRQRRALKVMHKALINDDEAVRRFTGEALKAGQVYHQNVAAVVDCGETADGMAYLVMEYVAGESLTRLLEREGALAPARVADIIAQAAEGLSAAHDMGIVHRDMKPDNVMISVQRDGSELVKVVDFGIAKATQDVSTQVTRPGWVIGTPEYMSPEQASACELDRRSDIYSLALVAFHMLTGKLPFQGASPQAVMLVRVTTPPASLAEVRGDVAWAPALQAVFDRALARAPDDRYATAREFSYALRAAVCEGAGVQPPPLRPNPWLARGRLATVGGALALTTALLAAGVYWRRHDPASTGGSTTVDGTLAQDTLLGRDLARANSAAAGGGRVDTLPSAAESTGLTARRADAHIRTRPRVATTSGGTVSGGTVPGRTAGGGAATDTRAGGGSGVRKEPPPFNARAALDTLKRLTDPETATEESARRALVRETALLPRLTNPTDSVEAGMRRLEAYLHLDDQTRACALLDRLSTQALGTSFERSVSAYRESPLLRCSTGY